jgi:two-component system chemotaxis response regulator CheY
MLNLSTRVLLVDDMPAMRTLVRGMLEQIGFRDIVEAEDGDIAWQLIQREAVQGKVSFGLVVSDWNMPNMTGVDLLRALRSSNLTREVPFLMITGEGDRDHFIEAFNAGVSDFIVKPFDATHLSEKISDLMAAESAQDD